jgi:hypothetical protein
MPGDDPPVRDAGRSGDGFAINRAAQLRSYTPRTARPNVGARLRRAIIRLRAMPGDRAMVSRPIAQRSCAPTPREPPAPM